MSNEALKLCKVTVETFKYSWRIVDFDYNTKKYETSISLGSNILNIKLQKGNKPGRSADRTYLLPKQLTYSLKGGDDTAMLEATSIVKIKGAIWSKSELKKSEPSSRNRSAELKGTGVLNFNASQLQQFTLEADRSTLKMDFELELRYPFAATEVMTPSRDFKLVVGNKNVLVYRLYLAERGSSFKDIAKFPEGRVVIDEDISSEAVLEFIQYCYTENIQNLETHVKDLLLLSVKCKAYTLQQRCEVQLLQDLQKSDSKECLALELFSLGHQHQLKTLIKGAFVEINQLFHEAFGYKLPETFVDKPKEVTNAFAIAKHAADAKNDAADAEKFAADVAEKAEKANAIAREARQALIDSLNPTRGGDQSM